MQVTDKQWQSALDTYWGYKQQWLKQPPGEDVYVKDADAYQALMDWAELPKNGKVLDIGCGEGKIAQFIPPGLEYYGVDPLADKLPLAHGVTERQLGTGEDIWFYKEATFEAVIIHSVLDHTKDPNKVLRESYRVLKPGGLLLISNLIGDHQADHLWSFEVHNLVDIAKGVGFARVRQVMHARKENVLDLVMCKGSIGGSEEQIQGLVVLGGILIGDTLRLCQWIRSKARNAHVGRLHAVGDAYNADALELFACHSDVPIATYEVLPGFERVSFAWEDADRFQSEGRVENIASDFDKADAPVFSPKYEDLNCSLHHFGFENADPAPFKDLPDEYIVVQPSSRSNWKAVPQLLEVDYPLPVVTVGRSGEQAVKGSIDRRGLILSKTASVIQASTLMVGIDSCLAQLAAQIDVPAIKVHFGGWEFDHRNVRDCGGCDLMKQTASKGVIEGKIAKALEMVRAAGDGLCSLSALSQK